MRRVRTRRPDLAQALCSRPLYAPCPVNSRALAQCPKRLQRAWPAAGEPAFRGAPRGPWQAPPSGRVAEAWRMPSCGDTLLARFWAPGTDPVTRAPGRGTMGIATLATWLLTAGIGAYMLRTWIVRGGPRMRRAAGDRLPPIVVYGHA